MKSFLLTIVLIVCGSALAESSKKPNFEIILPQSLEASRLLIENSFLSADAKIAIFAQKYDWASLVEKPFIKEARIFDSKADFDRAVINFLGYPAETKLPSTFCAALENEVFFSVSPDLYSEIYEDGREPLAFEKLITHEIAHRLHVRVLNGNEEAMGPVWFFEGFAIYAANQFEDSLPNLTEQEIMAIMESPNRGSYKKYASVIRSFLKKTTLKDMISHAADENFNQWLRSLSSSNNFQF